MRHIAKLLIATCVSANASEAPYCGPEGVWVQILGSGGLELDNQRAAPSYLVWIDDKARVLIDAGSGAALRFDESGADFSDLDAIALSHLHVDHTGDLPSIIAGSRNLGRTRPLSVLGPAGTDTSMSTQDHIERLIGPDGAYNHLSEFLTPTSPGGYRISIREVQATGNRVWAKFNNRDIKLSAIPVHHGDIPTLAWRVEVGEQSLVFAGDFNNLKNVIPRFAKDADVLVVSHALPEGARGLPREEFAIPSQIGRVAATAGARILILAARTTRTFGMESNTKTTIEANFDGSLIFGGELECWGL